MYFNSSSHFKLIYRFVQFHSRSSSSKPSKSFSLESFRFFLRLSSYFFIFFFRESERFLPVSIFGKSEKSYFSSSYSSSKISLFSLNSSAKSVARISQYSIRSYSVRKRLVSYEGGTSFYCKADCSLLSFNSSVQLKS